MRTLDPQCTKSSFPRRVPELSRLLYDFCYLLCAHFCWHRPFDKTRTCNPIQLLLSWANSNTIFMKVKRKMNSKAQAHNRSLMEILLAFGRRAEGLLDDAAEGAWVGSESSALPEPGKTRAQLAMVLMACGGMYGKESVKDSLTVDDFLRGRKKP